MSQRLKTAGISREDERKLTADEVSKAGFILGPGTSAEETCLYRPSCTRHEGGIIPARAPAGNVGTCRLYGKGEIQVEALREL